MQLTKNLKQFFGFLILALSLGGLLGATSVQAAQCKGLSQSKCEGAAECSWVKSYKSKSGNTVDAYCRSKPSKSSSKKTTSSTSSDDKKKSSSTGSKSDKK